MKKNNIKYLCLFFYIIIFCACGDGNKSKVNVKIVSFAARRNDLKLEMDSILIPTERRVSTVRLKLTNNTNKKIILFFEPINSKYETKNLLLVSSKADTIRLIVKDKYVIFNEHSETSFNVRLICEIDEVGDVVKFKKRFLEGSKIVYSNCKLTQIFLGFNHKNNYTLFTPKSIKGDSKMAIFVYDFLDGSNSTLSKKIK